MIRFKKREVDSKMQESLDEFNSRPNLVDEMATKQAELWKVQKDRWFKELIDSGLTPTEAAIEITMNTEMDLWK